MLQKNSLIEKARNFIKSDKINGILDLGFSFEIIDKKNTKYVIKWRNDQEILSHFFNQEKLTEKKQDKFLTQQLKNEVLFERLIKASSNSILSVTGENVYDLDGMQNVLYLCC